MFSKVSIFLCAMAAAMSISRSALVPQSSSNSLISPCPELFQYEIVDKPNQWTGSLILRSDFDLRGVWIRLVFDKEVKDVTVDGGDFEIKKDDDKKQVRVHNRTLTLDADAQKILKITVMYDGEAPSLIEYRLNARTICPQANINRQDIFQGDSKSDYFLASLKDSSNVFPQPTQHKCGVSQVPKSHPWQASVYINIGKEEQYTCAGTLIAPSYVITAAHCVTFKNDYTVVPRAFVTVYLSQERSSKDALRSLVADIQVHPGYNNGSLLDDVAILKLVKPIQVTDTFRPICLGERKVNESKAVIVGYEAGNGKLAESNVLMIDPNECMTVAPHLQGVLTYETYCLSCGSDDKKCVGDSGSSLVTIGTDGIATLDGIVTLSAALQNKNDGTANSVIIVSELNRYLSWIKHIIY